MARYLVQFSVDSATPVALVAATAKTVAQISIPANGTPRGCITAVHVGSQGTNTTDGPILIELYRSTTAGTLTAVTGKKRNSSDGGTVSNHITGGKNATVEPTPIDILFQTTIHPQTSRGWDYPLYREFFINLAPTSEQFNVRLTAAQGQNVFWTIEVEV